MHQEPTNHDDHEALDAAPVERFPTVIFAGPGCLFLLLVLTAPGAGAGVAMSGLMALLSAVCFGFVGAKARTEQGRTIGALLAFAGPVLFCLILMARL